MRSRSTAIFAFFMVSAPLGASAADLRVGITRYDGGTAMYGIAENQQLICDHCPKGPDLVLAPPRPVIRFEHPVELEPAFEAEAVLPEEIQGIEVSAPPVKEGGFAVYFAFNKATLTPAEKQKLRAAVAGGLDPSVTVRVDGYTCRVGTEKYNQRLSECRAKAVADYLRSLGIKVSSVEGLGEKHKVGAVIPRDRRAEVIIKERN